MKKKHFITYGKLIKKDGKLIHVSMSDAVRYREFEANIAEGQTIEYFMETITGDITNAQLARIHAMLRELSFVTGNTVEQLKLTMKKKCGLCIKKSLEGENFLVCKSLADCSSQEANVVINYLLELGDSLGIQLR